jgi:integrase/recombinase XerD
MFSSKETKNHRPIDFDVPDPLIGPFRDYLAVDRPLLQRRTPSAGLWITYRGDVMTGHGLYVMVAYRTRKAFGREVNLHLFRDAAATSVAIDDPDNVRIATTLLGHATLATTARHYNQARMLAAARTMQANVHKLRRQVLAKPRYFRRSGTADTFPRDGADR